MATFCSKCGTQLEGNERFCVKCGNDVMAPAGAPAAAPPMAPAPPPPGYPAHVPMPFVAPGQVPMSVAMPPPAPAHKSGMLWLVIIVALAVGGWYYYKHTPQSVTPPATAPGQQPGTQPAPQPAPPPAPQPGGAPGELPAQQPGGAPGQPPAQQPGGAPGQPPAQQPGGGPGQQPGGAPGGGGNNAALVQQQEFSGRWVPQNGNVEVEDAKWVNHSNATIQSATLMCVQYASTGTIIFQTTMVLNGPTATGATSTFPSFPMGAIQQAMAKVQCGFVAVTPAQ
jgi:hypothetical protein